MIRAVIDAYGRLDLTNTPLAPGQLVDVLVASSGTVYVSPSDLSQVVDLQPVKPLKTRGRQSALAAGRQR